MAIDGTLPLRFEQIAFERTTLLRHEVLWPDLPIEEVKLPEDENGWHFGAFIDEPDPIAVISIFLNPIPADNVAELAQGGVSRIVARFRKFACKTSRQGQGIGTALLRYAMQFARVELKAEVLWCDARVSSADWYSRRGLSQFGQNFYKGTVEYVRMKVEL